MMKKETPEKKALKIAVVVAVLLLAIVAFEKLLVKDLISELGQGKRPKDAKKELRELIDEEPDNIKAKGWLLRLYVEDRELKEADPLLSYLLIKAPDSYLTQFGACKYNLIKKRERKAVEHCKKALELSERSATDLNNLAAAYLYQDEYVKATELLGEAAAKDPRNENVLNNLGFAYRERKLYKEAEENLKKALELDPQFTAARKNLAQLYFQTEQTDKCIAEIKKVLKNNPDDYKSMLILAVVYVKFKDDLESAKKYARKSLQIKETKKGEELLTHIRRYEAAMKAEGNSMGTCAPSSGD